MDVNGATSDLSGSLIGAVARTYRRLRAERGTDDLSDTQHTVLARLTCFGPCTPTELAEHSRVTGPSMHQAVTGLVDAGLVVRAPDPHDRRKVQVVPTSQGEVVAAEARRRRHEWLDSRLDALSADQRATLGEAAAILRDLADS